MVSKRRFDNIENEREQPAAAAPLRSQSDAPRTLQALPVNVFGGPHRL
jgi:hypothetical protein